MTKEATKAEAAPKDVLTTKANQATACRGRWSQCSGKFQNVNAKSWHICHRCSARRLTDQKAGFTRPGVKGTARKSAAAPAAKEPKGLSAAKAGMTIRVTKAAAEADDVPAERTHVPPRSVLSQPVSRVVNTSNAVTSALLKAR